MSATLFVDSVMLGATSGGGGDDGMIFSPEQLARSAVVVATNTHLD